MLKRFQDLDPAVALTGTEIVPITQAGGDVQTTTQDIADLASSGGTVDSVVAGTGIDVDATDPANPEVALDAATITSLGLADTAVQPADVIVPIGLAASDETTALTTGTAKVTFRMPFGLSVTGVRASLTTAQTSGSIFTVDINESGSTILSTKLTIDNGEKTSTTAATPPVISDSALADDAEITIDIDQVGDGTAKGLKVWILGTKV